MEINKVNRGEKFSPRGRRLLLKKDGMGSLKPLVMEPPGYSNKESIGKLEKKGTKKLIIKTNDKKSEENSGQKIEQPGNSAKIT
jgi:hypothetical protein